MRCRPLRWLWGLIPMIGWAAVVVLGEHKSVEADLGVRAKAALEGSGLAWAAADFQGRDAVLSGKAAEDNEPLKAADVLSGVWGVRVVENRAGLIEAADAYVWGAIVRENRVRLSGFVPNDETRRMIYGVAQAVFPNREIQDQTKLARGAPPRDAWLGGVSFGLKQLAQLKRGSFELDKTAITIEGEALDSKAYAALKSALASGLPAGVTVKDDRVRPPTVSPFAWSLAWDGRQVAVAGYAPGEKVRDVIAAEVRKAFPRATLTDRTEVASGEPRDFEKIIAALMPAVASLAEASVDIKDQQVTIAGLAATDVAAEAVREALKAALSGTGVRLAEQLKYRETVPKPVSPFVTTAEVDATAVTLTGYVPGETQRTQFVDAIRARFPSLRIDDRMALAAGAPDGWFACLDSGLQALVRLRTGSIQMTDRQLVLAGQTTDEDMHAALPAELKAGANRACETEFKVALNVLPEPNFAWRAVRTANELVLEGDVPGADAKAELVKLAASLFPGLPVIDRMAAQPVTAPKWTRTAEAALKALARLRTGEALIAEQTLTVAGEAGDTARATAVKDILARGLPRGYAGREMVALRSDAMIWAEQEAKKKAEDDARRKAEDEARRKAEDELRRKTDEAAARKKAEDDARAKAAEEARKAEDARKAEEARKKAEAEEARRKADAEALARATPQQKAAADRCTTLLASAARTGRITFGFDSAALEPQSSATLDKLVEIAKTCPDARIDISGHTDAVGSAEHNEQLSQQRAEAVVEYLAAKGVDRGRLTATGYGSTRPLVPNTTAANRAQNRRIEFTAKPR